MAFSSIRAIVSGTKARVKSFIPHTRPKTIPKPIPSTFSPPHTPSITKFNQRPQSPYTGGGRMPEQHPLSNLSPQFIQRTPGNFSLYRQGANGNSSRSSLLEGGGGTYHSSSWELF